MKEEPLLYFMRCDLQLAESVGRKLYIKANLIFNEVDLKLLRKDPLNKAFHEEVKKEIEAIGGFSALILTSEFHKIL